MAGVQGKKVRVVNVRKITGRKSIKNKLYTYEYYTLSLNLYIPKDVVERYGSEFVVVKDDESGTITVMPKALAKERGIEIR